MERRVEIQFDCLPLRSLRSREIPEGGSPKFRAFYERVVKALDKHGAYNSYYLHKAHCTFCLLNHAERGLMEFQFEGTVLTDEQDQKALHADLTVTLLKETCDWLTEPVVEWFHETVRHAVLAEFDLYITHGDLAKTLARLEQMQAQLEAGGGFVGMYL